MEAAILTAEERKPSLEASLGDPATYQREDAASAGKLKSDLEAASPEVERLYARWQDLEALRAGGARPIQQGSSRRNAPSPASHARSRLAGVQTSECVCTFKQNCVRK